MKTLNLKMIILAAITIIFAILPSLSNAQITTPYPVYNLIPCTVIITWQPMDNSGTLCGTAGSTGVSSGATYNIPASNFTGCHVSAMNVRITVSGPASGSAQGPGSNTTPLAGSGPCLVTNPAHVISWTSSMCTLNP